MDREQIANEIYIRVAQPETIWWDDLTPEMQEAYLRAADFVLQREVLLLSSGALGMLLEITIKKTLEAAKE